MADPLWGRWKRESRLVAVRLAFEPADFGQIAGLKAGSEIELRDIRAKLWRATACWLCNFGRNTGDDRRRVVIVTLAPLNEAPS